MTNFIILKDGTVINTKDIKFSYKTANKWFLYVDGKRNDIQISDESYEKFKKLVDAQEI